MSTSKPLDEPIHERFPLLSESDDTPDDVRADLDLTDTELGTRYRRGKQTRLNRYQQLEDALALQAAHNYQATTEPILEVLQELMGGAPTLLDGLMSVVPVMKEDQLQHAVSHGRRRPPTRRPDPAEPREPPYAQELSAPLSPISDPPLAGGIPDLADLLDDVADRWLADPEEWRTSDLSDGAAESRLPTPWTGAELPEVRYIFSTIEHGAPVAVGAHRLDAVLTVMSGLDLDPTSVDLFREVICCLKPPSSLSAISKRHGTSRQAMSVRRQRLARRLSRTRGESAIAALEKFAHQRLKTVTHRPADDPFLSIALSTLDQKFPNAVDAVRLGLWLASPEGHGEVPVGFVLYDEGELIPR
jgi:hypothetical protein